MVRRMRVRPQFRWALFFALLGALCWFSDPLLEWAFEGVDATGDVSDAQVLLVIAAVGVKLSTFLWLFCALIMALVGIGILLWQWWERTPRGVAFLDRLPPVRMD